MAFVTAGVSMVEPVGALLCDGATDVDCEGGASPAGEELHPASAAVANASDITTSVPRDPVGDNVRALLTAAYPPILIEVIEFNELNDNTWTNWSSC